MTFKIIPKHLIVYFIRSIREYLLDNNETFSAKNVTDILLKMGARKIPKRKKLERIICFISNDIALRNKQDTNVR
jgi:hypothetical protein